MSHQSYSIEQAQFLEYVVGKVRQLFDEFKAPAHGFDHAQRVAKWAVQIAETEKSDVFMCELAAWLHDIGRVPEHNGNNPDKKTHHELSYEMLQRWFAYDDFTFLTRDQKLELLYAVRFHWNDAADEYQSAIILRDADKLDTFGQIGIDRSVEWKCGDMDAVCHDMRFRYQFLYWLRTEAAKKYIDEHDLFEPVHQFYIEQLKKRIPPVTLLNE